MQYTCLTIANKVTNGNKCNQGVFNILERLNQGKLFMHHRSLEALFVCVGVWLGYHMSSSSLKGSCVPK
jgi:hypothetical protein